MKHLIPCLLLALTPVFAQSGDCTKVFVAPQNSGGKVSMTLRAGDIDIVGSRDNTVRVTCRLDREEDEAQVKIRFAAGQLRIFGGPNKGVHYRVEVPEKTALYIRASAGDVEVKGITGDKDVELRAGDLKIDVGDPASYRVAEGKVTAGNLSARPFGSQKEGLFRSFRKDNAGGRYRLRVELLAGDLTLK